VEISPHGSLGEGPKVECEGFDMRSIFLMLTLFPGATLFVQDNPEPPYHSTNMQDLCARPVTVPQDVALNWILVNIIFQRLCCCFGKMTL